MKHTQLPISREVSFWAHRHILWQTTLNDIKIRFAGSVLGKSWLLLYPVLMLGAYSLVYIYVFKIRFALFNSNEYVLFIFCGLIPFLGFSEAFGLGVSSVTGNSSLIRNTLFPIELIPAKAVLVSQCTQAAGMVLLLIALALFGKLTWWALLIVPIWFAQIMFMLGVIWVLSSLNVYFRDIQTMVPIIIMLLMMVSPIAYTPEMVPEGLRQFLRINPLYYFIVSYQEVLMLGRFPEHGSFWIVCIMGIAGFELGRRFFSTLKKVFADNV